MVKFNFHKLKRVIIAFSLLTCVNLEASPPKWNSGYPKIVNGATTADLSFKTDQNSSVYYVVYNSAPSNVTAASVKSAATASISGNIVKNGVIKTSTGVDTKSYIKGLKDGNTYYVYVVAENEAKELQVNSEVKNYTIKLPVRHSENSYRTSLATGMVGYMAYFPEEYYKNPSANYPVLVFLHGNGEKTWMLDNTSLLYKVKKNGVPMLIDQGQEFPFIVISPQCPFADWDDINGTLKPGALVNEVIEMAKATYRVDVNRVYLTGISMGGGGTFSYLQNYPSKVAAAIPIAGWGDPGKACNYSDVPVWVFHGSKDGPSGVENVVNKYNTCNPTEKAKLTVYQGVGHDAWTITYNNSGPGIAPENIYDWLLKHSRNVKSIVVPNVAPTANAGTDQKVTLPTDKVTLNGTGTDKDGTISSYSWSKISGPSATLNGTSSKTLTLSSLSAGTYTFRLTVTDNSAGKATDDVSIVVNPAPVVVEQVPAKNLTISNLTLADADKDIDIVSPFENGYTLNLASTGVKYFTIVAKTTSKDIGSMVFTYDGKPFRTENYAPFSFTGNCFSGYVCYNSWWAPTVGSHTIVATAFSGANGTGTKGSSKSVTFTVVDGTSAAAPITKLKIGSLVLADAEKYNEIAITNNSLNLATAGGRYYTFVAKNTTSDVKSIVFSLNGSPFRTENFAPFSFTGNCYKGYTCYNAWWTPDLGKQTITATAYSEANGKGTKGETISVTLNVTNSGNRAGELTGNFFASKISVSPNPFNDKVNLVFDQSIEGKAKISMTDALGHEVYKSEVENSNNTGLEIDLTSEGMKTGLYLLRVETENKGVEVFKLLKN